jgi:hypothetical protein
LKFRPRGDSVSPSLLEGMASAGWDDPAYRAAYRECMKPRLERRR